MTLTSTGGQSALEFACHAKEWKLVQALVNAGANVNTQFQGMPPALPMAQKYIDFEWHACREGQ